MARVVEEPRADSAGARDRFLDEDGGGRVPRHAADGRYHVEIVAVRTENDTLVVDYVERRPGRGMMTAQILTEPFHLVSLPKHDGPVRFVPITGPGR